MAACLPIFPAIAFLSKQYSPLIGGIVSRVFPHRGGWGRRGRSGGGGIDTVSDRGKACTCVGVYR